MREYNDLKEINEKLVEGILKKKELVCNDAIDLIGVYGSFQTGDIHERSDLDLMIVINDDEGWKISKSAIIGDIGYDIYCTPWTRLEEDSEYKSPYISKLLNSKIIYKKNDDVLEKLNNLRNKALENLKTLKSEEEIEKSIKEVKINFSNLILSKNKSEKYLAIGLIIYYLENILCFINNEYFKLGVKRHLEEIERFKLKPNNYSERIIGILKENKEENLIKDLKELIEETIDIFEKSKLNKKKNKVKQEDLKGSYEEMYSNWRNKVYMGVKEDDIYSVFSSMVSLQLLIKDISNNIDIKNYDVLENFNNEKLEENLKIYDDFLNDYLSEYKNINLKSEVYDNVQEFLQEYLR